MKQHWMGITITFIHMQTAILQVRKLGAIVAAYNVAPWMTISPIPSSDNPYTRSVFAHLCVPGVCEIFTKYIKRP